MSGDVGAEVSRSGQPVPDGNNEKRDVGAEVAAVLADHGPSGYVNSREGWVECECGERLQLPSGLTFDGYPEMWEEERKARDAHVADALAPLIAARVEAAKAEAVTTLAMQFRQRGLEEAAQITLDIAAVLAGGREGEEQ